MRDLLTQVLDLQPDWSTGNSEEMQVRGMLVRDELPARLRANVPTRDRRDNEGHVIDRGLPSIKQRARH
ncbi:hypothetical protein [Microbacterium sp. NPDC076895]|uniref:hypothetical protein n=1 Tax=Microbacterium sp. NPDC076895 TaxID=3154957 RepID=UPI00343C81AE